MSDTESNTEPGDEIVPFEAELPVIADDTSVGDEAQETPEAADATDVEDAAELTAPLSGDDGEAVRYEVVFESRDRTVGGRLVAKFEEVIGPTWNLRRTEEGPTWATTVEFPSRARADRFFKSNFYRQFCNDVRRSCGSSVLVVPLGASKD